MWTVNGIGDVLEVRKLEKNGNVFKHLLKVAAPGFVAEVTIPQQLQDACSKLVSGGKVSVKALLTGGYKGQELILQEVVPAK